MANEPVNEPNAPTKVEFGDNYTEQFTVFIVGTLIGGVLVAIIAAVISYFLIKPNNSELEYYRGAYDTCVVVNANMFNLPEGQESYDVCNNFVEKIKSDKWYSTDSAGYK